MINSPEELISLLRLEDIENVENTTHLNDVKCGISLQLKYPDNIRYKPPKTKNNIPDTYALIKITYRHPKDRILPAKQNSKMPIHVSISSFSRFTATHFDYNFDDDNCPTRISLEESKRTPTPVSLSYPNDYFYDDTSNINSFLNSNNERITGAELINEVFEEHCNTVHKFKSLKLRSKLNFKSQLINISNSTVNHLVKLLKTVFGRTLDSNPTKTTYYGYEKKDLKKLKTESIEILGYKTGSKIIILFCILGILSYAAYQYFNLNIPYARTILTNNFLTLIHVIFTLWFLDVVLPNSIFRTINTIIKFKNWLIQFKISTK